MVRLVKGGKILGFTTLELGFFGRGFFGVFLSPRTAGGKGMGVPYSETWLLKFL